MIGFCPDAGCGFLQFKKSAPAGRAGDVICLGNTGACGLKDAEGSCVYKFEVETINVSMLTETSAFGDSVFFICQFLIFNS